MKMHNILVVDDETDNCFLIKEILKAPNLNFFYAYNGEDAIKISRVEHIDLVFMDLKMPGMNGFEATLKIKDFKPYLTVILQTAFARELRKDDFIYSIVDDIIGKPLVSKELKSKFEKYMKKLQHECA